MKGSWNIEVRSRIEDCVNLKEVFDYEMTDVFKDRVVLRYIQNNEAVAVMADTYHLAVRRLASALQKKGYNRSHIAIISANSYEYLLLYTAIVYSGNVAVLISKDSSEDQIKAECELADVNAVFSDALSAEKVNSVCRDLGIDFYEIKSGIDTLCSDDIPETIENNTGREDLITIFFTSGTTGKSKAVAMANRSMFNMMTSPTVKYEGHMVVLPLHHIAALSMYLSTMGTGNETHICSGIENFIRDLKLFQTDCVLVVPMLLNILLIRLRKAGLDQSKLGWNLKIVGCGGAAFPADVIEDFNKAGIELPQYYGMSETGGGGLWSIMTPENRFSIGNKAVYGHVADIIDGELVLKSKRCMLGYYKDPEETKKIMYDGWVHTGDLARIGEDGYYYLIGRKKNLIILANGENVSPEEIEAQINTCEDVTESIVYGEGKFLHICVYPAAIEDASVEEVEAIKERIRKHVERYNEDAPTYKQLRFVEFRDTPFNKNSAGKIVRDNRSE